MNIGYLALGFAALGGIITLIGFTQPQGKPTNPEPNYNKIYQAMRPKEL